MDYTTHVSDNVNNPLDIFTNQKNSTPPSPHRQPEAAAATPNNPPLSRYENQKRRDWVSFWQYLRNHRPPLSLCSCSGAHILEFLKYLDQFGRTKVHDQNCPFFGIRNPPAPCPCPLKQAWGSLDALIGRLRAAYEYHGGGKPQVNPFGASAVRLFLRDVRDFQSKSRGVSYQKTRKSPNGKEKTVAAAKMNSHVVATTPICGKIMNSE